MTISRDRCYGCFRPRGDCFCAAIPSIANRTEIVILQHVRERFHPFNTARIVSRALRNSTLLVDQTDRIAARLALQPNSAILYPGRDAALLDDLPVDRRPQQLLILDGTWHHAKTMMRDIPILGTLPRFRLAPTMPGRYRIRREPDAISLSTVEATVAALLALEPDTPDLDRLIGAFDAMVERQLAHPKAEYGRRHIRRHRITPKNIPSALLGDLRNVVVAYGESSIGGRGSESRARAPVYWVAERLSTGERFQATLRPAAPFSNTFLEHLELSETDFAEALTISEFREAWRSFIDDDEILAVYNPGTARLLTQTDADFCRTLVLKSVDLDPQRRFVTLEEQLAAEGVVPLPTELPGRAGRRLANVAAFVRHLNVTATPSIDIR
ncbi:MAG: DTW domain-containing protein [Planctomycetia bacterium]|nr:DTW domain-containing protein [Planctomycetia bacterium]